MKIAFVDRKAVSEKTECRELDYILNRFAAVLDIVHIDADENADEILKDVEGILTAYLMVDAAFLDHTPNLKVISLMSTGYNTIDVAECKRRGIAVVNVEDYCTEEVATHTIALMLALVRNLKNYDMNVHNGIWTFGIPEEVSRVSMLTLTIFGYGKIGKKVAKLAQAFGMRIGVVSEHLTKEQAKEDGVELFTKEQAWKESDIISNHMALSLKTEKYFDSIFFNELEKNPFFINVGRGGSVDEPALLEALDLGLIRGAGLDVMEEETPDLTESPFLNRKNVILTPHAAFYSNRSMQALSEIACDNLLYALQGKKEQVKGYV